MDWSSVPGYDAAHCPSIYAITTPYNANVAYDWSVSGSQCIYAKSIAGILSSTLTKVDGTTYAAGTYKDLSGYSTMGLCLANGGTWSNWVGQGAESTIANGTDGNTYKKPQWDYTAQSPDADNGCLHCHSTTVQYNSSPERWKDSYLKTGHKNMLRKVTAGKSWAGPCVNGQIPNADGLCVYTTDGTNAIDFSTGKITVSGTPQNLYYVYADWMTPLPSVVYGTNGYGSLPGPTNGYTATTSCAGCHTAGYSDNNNPGVQSIGTPGYAGLEPQESFPGINLNPANPKWDLNGIQCSRCHNAEVGPVAQGEITGGWCGSGSSIYQVSGQGANTGCASQTACTNAGGSS